ncbi:unnamed protein product, partial [Brachionus calyciflorus]
MSSESSPLVILESETSDEEEVQKNSGNNNKASYTLEFKYKVICFINKGNSINKCAKEFKIDRRIISRWKRLEPRILENKKKRQRRCVKSLVDRCQFPILETNLFNWITDKRSQGICLSGLSIKLQAMQLFKTIYENTPESNIEFKASNGWFENFCTRKDLVLRRITSSGRDLPKNTIDILKQFFSDCSASGEKIQTFILLPRKTDLPNYTPPDDVKVKYKINATFDEHMICEFAQTVLVEYMLKNGLDEIYLFLDSARFHTTVFVKNTLKNLNIVPVFIPPRFTNLIQPADVCWFASL